MNTLTKVVRTAVLSRPVLSSSGAVSQQFAGAKRCYVKVGDKVNITFVKGKLKFCILVIVINNEFDSYFCRREWTCFFSDEAPIVIKEDKEYPEWVFKLSEKVSI